MKNYILIILLVVVSAFAKAQNITAAEYFIDTDPGVGQGTALTINNVGNDITDTFTVNIGNLPIGFHRLYTRVQDANGVWSHYDKMLFYVADSTPLTSPTLPNITEMEYFIDTDPGVGQATSVAVNNVGPDITDTFTLNIGTLSQGFHRMYTRVKDANNTWSLYDKFLFYVADTTPIANPALPAIVAAEYFLGADPGFGNATAVTLTPTGMNDFFMVDVDLSGITSCTTTPFHLRVQDANGVWSLYDFDPAVLVDFDAPTVIGQDITIDLAGNTSISITASDVDNGSTDACSAITLTAAPDTFTAVGVYNVTLTATDDFGNSSTTVVQVTVDDTLGNENFNFEKSVKIYPNPTHSNLFIESQEELQSIELFDLSGKRLFSLKDHVDKINLERFSQGIYLIKLTSINGGVLTRKVIKN